MASGTPQDVADRWASRLAGATTKIQQGVQAVTQAPQAKAAAAAQTWLARLNQPETLAKYVSSLQKSTLADWQNGMLQKGIQRISQGANAAKPKFAAFMTQFLPFVNNVAQQVRSMPNVTLEDRIARMVAQVRGAAAFRRSG